MADTRTHGEKTFDAQAKRVKEAIEVGARIEREMCIAEVITEMKIRRNSEAVHALNTVLERLEARRHG